jgi:hypothetical protein
MIKRVPTFVSTLPRGSLIDRITFFAQGLFVLNHDGMAWRVDSGTGRLLWQMPEGRPKGRIAPLPGGEEALWFDPDGSVTRLDTRSGLTRPAGHLPHRVTHIHKVLSSPCGRWVFVDSKVPNGTAWHDIYGDYETTEPRGFLWDVHNQCERWCQDGYKDREESDGPIRFSPEGDELLLPGVSKDTFPMAWFHCETGAPVRVFTWTQWMAHKVVTRDSRLAIHGGQDLHAWLKGIKRYTLSVTTLDTVTPPSTRLLAESEQELRPLVLGPDEAYVVTLEGGTLGVRDRQDGRLLSPPLMLPDGFAPRCATLAPAGDAFVMGSKDSRIARYELEAASP